MAQSTIAIIIVASALILYVIPAIPLSVTTVLAMLAMAFTGIIPYEKAFSGFSSDATLLVVGMMIIGKACFTTGLAKKLSKVLCHFTGMSERSFATVLFVLACALGVFLNGALIVPLLMTMVNCVSSSSGGKFTRKNLYFPIGMGATLGNNMTTISGTSTITALGIYYAAGYATVGLFQPLLINLPAFLVAVAVYAFVGYPLSVRVFDFPDVQEEEACAAKDTTTCVRWKMLLTGAVLIGVIIALVAGCNFGATALAGSVILILTGCISEKEAFQSVSWSTVVVLAGSIGISAGFTASGAGAICANFIINTFGAFAQTPFAMCVILFFAGTLISNVMSDNAAAAILTPIAIGIGVSMGEAPLPFVLSVAFGVKDAISTPLSVATMTMLQPAGYRFTDYVKVAGIINLTMVVVGCVMMKLVFFP